MLVNRHSDFQARGLLTGVDFMGDIGLSSVNPPLVETISASIISLNSSDCHTYQLVCIFYQCFQELYVHI